VTAQCLGVSVATLGQPPSHAAHAGPALHAIHGYTARVNDPGEATRILRRLREGDAAAAEELAPLVYDELHRLARNALGRARPGHTLQPTALVNEAWMRLVGLETEWAGRSHFIGVAAKAMRSVLVDHARARSADKRGGAHARLELDEGFVLFEERAVDVLALEQALEELSVMDPFLAQIIELRFFGGLNQPEVAEHCGTPLRTVERGWQTARAWMFQRVTTILDEEERRGP
jgi:RNA polymerase sigma-70 factor (ECF subfamily)